MRKLITTAVMLLAIAVLAIDDYRTRKSLNTIAVQLAWLSAKLDYSDCRAAAWNVFNAEASMLTKFSVGNVFENRIGAMKVCDQQFKDAPKTFNVR